MSRIPQERYNQASTLTRAALRDAGMPHIPCTGFSSASPGDSLHEAARNNALEPLKSALAAGADPNAPNALGEHPVALAVWGGARTLMPPLCLKALLEAGGDPNTGRCELDGQSAIEIAIFERQVTCLRMLLRAGALPNEPLVDGLTPLMIAVNSGRLASVEILLEAGAETNAADRFGQTALMKAAARGWIACAQALLAAGADPLARDDKDRDAKAFALFNQQVFFAEWMEPSRAASQERLELASELESSPARKPRPSL